MSTEQHSTLKKKILVIDDEILGPTLAKMHSLAETFFSDLEDTDQDIFIHISKFLEENYDRFKLKPDEIKNNLIRLRKIIFTDFFKTNIHSDVLKELKSVYSEYDRLIEIKNKLNDSFPPHEFEIIFEEEILEEHKNEDFISGLSLIIVDLFLFTNSNNDDAQSLSYLDSISSYKNLPPIILISSRFSKMEPNELATYFEKTNISATGLTPLSKNKITSDDFGILGLSLLFEKMEAQRNLSNITKLHIETWKKTLATVTEKFSNTLWNLDAYIMQSIFKDADADAIPFEELLNNFLTRELLWHIESDNDLKASVKELEKLLEQNIKNNLYTHVTDIKAHRDMLGHYFYYGGIENNKLLLSACNDENYQENLLPNILHLLPFGAVLKSEIEADHIYINITQQCDLADFPRKYALNKQVSENSIIFAKTKINKKSISECIEFNGNNYISIVELSSSFTGSLVETYDISPDKANLISSNIENIKELITKEQLVLIGKLRTDIVDSFQKKIALQMLRPSQQIMNRMGTKRAKIYIKTQEAIIDYNDDLHIIIPSKKQILIPSRFGLNILLWIKNSLSNLEIDINNLNKHLTNPLNIKGENPLKLNEQSTILFKIIENETGNFESELSQENASRQPKILICLW